MQTANGPLFCYLMDDELSVVAERAPATELNPVEKEHVIETTPRFFVCPRANDLIEIKVSPSDEKGNRKDLLGDSEEVN